jgi:hypothetical protein
MAANTLAYYDKPTHIVVKRFAVQDPGVSFLELCHSLVS